MNIIYQFANEAACLLWKSKYRKDLIGKRKYNSPEIIFQGYSDDSCPKEILENVTFRGKDSYLLVLEMPIQPDNQIFYSPLVAKRLLAVRDAIIIKDIDEAFHQLYQIACPNFNKYLGEVWQEMEDLAEKCTIEV